VRALEGSHSLADPTAGPALRHLYGCRIAHSLGSRRIANNGSADERHWGNVRRFLQAVNRERTNPLERHAIRLHSLVLIMVDRETSFSVAEPNSFCCSSMKRSVGALRRPDDLNSASRARNQLP
jgi:hypothetical protein